MQAMGAGWRTFYFLMAVLILANCSYLADKVENTPVQPSSKDSGLQGAVLYAQNCASCHGDLANSARKDRTFEQIQAAFDRPQMAALKGKLSPEEVRAIVLVLRSEPDLIPPSMPAGFTAVAVNDFTIDLSWNAATDVGSGIAGYRLYRVGTLDPIDSLSSTSLNFTDTGRTALTQYTYEVEAVDNAGLTSPSRATVSATTPAVPSLPDTTPPGPPQSVAVTVVSSTRLKATWLAAQDNPGGSGIKEYLVYRNGVFRGRVGSAVREFIDLNLAQASSYSYVVRAVDYSGLFKDSAAVSKSTPLANGTTLYNSICLNCHISHSAIETSGIRNKPAVAIISAMATVVPMKNDTTRGLKSLGIDEIAAIAKALSDSTDLTAPTPPTNLSGIASETQINLGWTASIETGSGMKYYKVYRNDVEIDIVRRGLTAFQDTELTAATSYSYKLQAYDNFGNVSAFSTPLTLSTIPAGGADTTPPTAPSSLTLAPESYAVTLTWGAATDNVNVSKYNIYRGTTKVISVDSPLLTYRDLPLLPSTEYSYTVSSTDFAGNEGPKTAVKATTTLAPVGELLYISRKCYSCHGQPPDQFIAGQASVELFKSAYFTVIDRSTGRGPMQGMPRVSPADLQAIAEWAMTLQGAGGGGNPTEEAAYAYEVPSGTRSYITAKLKSIFVEAGSTDPSQVSRTFLINSVVAKDFSNLGGSCTRYDGAACPGGKLASLSALRGISGKQSAGRSGKLLNICYQILERRNSSVYLLSRAGLTTSSPINSANITSVYRIFFPGKTASFAAISSLEIMGSGAAAIGIELADRWQMVLLPLCEASLSEGF